MQKFKTFLTVIGAVTILVLAANSAVYAATGGKFILGKTNKANNVSTLKRTTNGPALSLITKSSSNAPLATNGRGKVTNLNADKIDGLDSTGFLRRGAVEFNEQRGWAAQNGSGGVVETYSNLQKLTGTASYYLSLTTPGRIGTSRFFLESVEICYNGGAPGDKIDATTVRRSSNDNYADETFADATDRTSIFPTTECYTRVIHDTAVLEDSAYSLELAVVGDVRVARVTSRFGPL